MKNLLSYGIYREFKYYSDALKSMIRNTTFVIKIWNLGNTVDGDTGDEIPASGNISLGCYVET